MVLYQQAGDGDAITCWSDEDGIYAGMFVKCTTATEMGVTSDITASDAITVQLMNASNDEDTCIGIAANDANNGEMVTVLRRGLFFLRAEVTSPGAITAGCVLQPADASISGGNYEVEKYDPADGARPCGQALSPADADDEYVLAVIDFGNGAGAI